MGLQDVIRFLLPREDHFYDFLEKQAVAAHRGATALSKWRDTKSTVEAIRGAVQEHEHDGDRIVHEMEEALAKTFVTPIDREDLKKLSAELDDILDLTNNTIRACSLLGLARPTEPMLRLVDLLAECTDALQRSMPELRRHNYQALMDVSRSVRKLEKDADAVYRDEVSRLFHDDSIDARQLLREKEVLEHLEGAIDHCEIVAETLAYLAVKHG